jgi:recombination protein RecA
MIKNFHDNNLPNSSGKTSIATSICVQAQKAYPDKAVAYIDIEQAFSPKYAQCFGLDLSEDKFLFCQPTSAEEACEIAEHLAASGACSVIIYDSIGGSLTQAQLEKGVDEATMGSLAKIMSIGSNKIKNACAATGTVCIFLNQVYDNIGSYGGGEKTKGGNSVPFFASIRLRVARRELIADPLTKEIIGQDIAIKFIKNKVGTPYKELTTKLIFGKGFDFISELVDLCVTQDLINKGGAWYAFESYKLQGKSRVVEVFENDPELLEKYKKLSTDKLLSKNTTTVDEVLKEELVDEDGYS